MHYSMCLLASWAAANGENKLRAKTVTPVVELIVTAAMDDLVDLGELACLALLEVVGCAFLPYSA